MPNLNNITNVQDNLISLISIYLAFWARIVLFRTLEKLELL